MRNNPQSFEECQAKIEALKAKIEDFEDQIRDLEWGKDNAEEELSELEIMLHSFPLEEDLAQLEADEEAERQEARQRELLDMAYKGFPRIPDNIADYWQRIG